MKTIIWLIVILSCIDFAILCIAIWDQTTDRISRQRLAWNVMRGISTGKVVDLTQYRRNRNDYTKPPEAA